MTMPQLLLRGMLVGVLAGLLAFTFAKVYGEPQVDRAIAVESAIAKAKDETPEPELVSRAVQSTLGLFTGVVVVGSALGGIFALLFALLWGRFATTLTPRSFAALLAAIAFVIATLVPDLKYPANPPSIGEPETIGLRTGLYFSMIAISIVAALAAFSLRKMVATRLGAWDATLVGAFAFVVMIAIACYALPTVNEVPEIFPAQTLWTFRLVSLGIQAILWGGIGLMFGALTERSLRA
jgi:Probable cobalt transporter subunit (CbtA)